MTQHISIPLGDGVIQLPADLIIQEALKHACGINHQADQFQGIPPRGKYWPGEGGFNGGLFQGGDRPYYLIVAGAEFEAEYGGYGRETEGASSAWDGVANTQALLVDSEAHPAAKLASEYRKDGHGDFYLAARRELQVLEANVASLFSKGWHVSSTQYSADGAYSMDFEGGWQDNNGKDDGRLVRPVRRVFIN